MGQASCGFRGNGRSIQETILILQKAPCKGLFVIYCIHSIYYFPSAFMTCTNTAFFSFPVNRCIFFFWNATMPSASAYRVSSFPFLTFFPGRNLVPRWRMIICPVRTVCPPKSLTPRRCPGESCTLAVEPPAFLCAILVYAFKVK